MDKEARHPNMILKAGGLKGAATVHVFSRGKQSHLPPRDDEEQGGGPVGWDELAGYFNEWCTFIVGKYVSIAELGTRLTIRNVLKVFFWLQR
ncbi:hypothetical protein CDAR_436551 [Caerostris darwini]|uniref:Uncharacterized protein n=1 Tax=Caerostris darwini TaxID=1538125 RepID=A0AAV4SGL6_9ARAC|nr:hypothetical protein CDAR_436551 [Caerostris darwini]